MAGFPDSEIMTFGRVGNPDYLKGLPPGSDGYRTLKTTFKPTAEEATLEEALRPVFEKPTGRISDRSWTILQDGSFRFEEQSELRGIERDAQEKDAPFIVTPKSEIIPVRALRGETLSPKQIAAIKMIVGVEAKTHEYSGAAFDLFPQIPTLIRFYHSWDTDESFHGPSFETILVETESIPAREMDKFLIAVGEHKWIPPFNTQRKMMIYPYPQETATGGTYSVLTGDIDKDPMAAPLSSRIIRKGPEGDENGHAGSFRKINVVLAILDPEGTAEDTFDVYEHFSMPGDAVMPSPRETIMAFRRLGIDRTYIARILFRCMMNLNHDVNPHLPEGKVFLDIERAKDLARYYAGKATTDEEFERFLDKTAA